MSQSSPWFNPFNPSDVAREEKRNQSVTKIRSKPKSPQRFCREVSSGIRILRGQVTTLSLVTLIRRLVLLLTAHSEMKKRQTKVNFGVQQGTPKVNGPAGSRMVSKASNRMAFKWLNAPFVPSESGVLPMKATRDRPLRSLF